MNLRTITRFIPACRRSAKSGGFPNFTNNAPSGRKDTPYKDSTSWSYKVGSKNRFLNGQSALNAALLCNTVKDKNLFSLDSASFTFIPKPIDAHNYGVELEGSYQLADSWTLSGGLDYTHAELRNVSEDVAASFGACNGNFVPAVPKSNTNLTLQYYAAADWLGLPGRIPISSRWRSISTSAATSSSMLTSCSTPKRNWSSLPPTYTCSGRTSLTNARSTLVFITARKAQPSLSGMAVC